jgi:hypothetical protein
VHTLLDAHEILKRSPGETEKGRGNFCTDHFLPFQRSTSGGTPSPYKGRPRHEPVRQPGKEARLAVQAVADTHATPVGK